jgi:hypothetical protein
MRDRIGTRMVIEKGRGSVRKKRRKERQEKGTEKQINFLS